MSKIYHFISNEDIARYLQEDGLRVPSLKSEGFIHCSTLEQVIDVANFLAPYDEELQLLEIDEARLSGDVKYENLEGGDKLFPHVYASIPRTAIIGQYQLEWDGEDGYSLPDALQAQRSTAKTTA